MTRDEQEFEMLCCVLVAHKRVLDATVWCDKGDTKFLAELSKACSALLASKEMCSDENVRAAEGMTA